MATGLLVAAATLVQAQPTFTASANTVVPGESVTLTVTGTPGENFAIIGSTTNAGFSFGGVALSVGADVTVLVIGVLDGTGTATMVFTPPFLGTTLDRYYVQAATSTSPSFIPPVPSQGLVLRNNDLVSGLGVVPLAAFGPGNDPNALTSLVLDFVGPTRDVSLAAGQKILMTAVKAMGAGATAASGMELGACYQLTGGTVTPAFAGANMGGLQVPANTRIPFAVSWVYSGLPAGTVKVGMCATILNPATWNNNEFGLTTALIIQ